MADNKVSRKTVLTLFIMFNLLVVLYEVQLSNLPKLPHFNSKVRISGASPHEDGMKGVKKGDESLREAR